MQKRCVFRFRNLVLLELVWFSNARYYSWTNIHEAEGLESVRGIMRIGLRCQPCPLRCQPCPLRWKAWCQPCPLRCQPCPLRCHPCRARCLLGTSSSSLFTPGSLFSIRLFSQLLDIFVGGCCLKCIRDPFFQSTYSMSKTVLSILKWFYHVTRKGSFQMAKGRYTIASLRFYYMLQYPKSKCRTTRSILGLGRAWLPMGNVIFHIASPL